MHWWELLVIGFACSMPFMAIGATLVMVRGAFRKTAKKEEEISSAAQIKALEVYRALGQEKLDIIKTALAMGYGHDEVARLDERLERLIGKDQLQQLASGSAPLPSTELQSVNLSDESRVVRELKAHG
jgi:hypothetical protein